MNVRLRSPAPRRELQFHLQQLPARVRRRARDPEPGAIGPLERPVGIVGHRVIIQHGITAEARRVCPSLSN